MAFFLQRSFDLQMEVALCRGSRRGFPLDFPITFRAELCRIFCGAALLSFARESSYILGGKFWGRIFCKFWV